MGMKQLILFFVIAAAAASWVACQPSKTKTADTQGAVDVSNMPQIASSEEEPQALDETGYLVRVGDIAPDFTIELTTGEQVRLSSLRGKVVMLHFTASWCGVCRKEMPPIQKEIWQQHK